MCKLGARHAHSSVQRPSAAHLSNMLGERERERERKRDIRSRQKYAKPCPRSATPPATVRAHPHCAQGEQQPHNAPETTRPDRLETLAQPTSLLLPSETTEHCCWSRLAPGVCASAPPAAALYLSPSPSQRNHLPSWRHPEQRGPPLVDPWGVAVIAQPRPEAAQLCRGPLLFPLVS